MNQSWIAILLSNNFGIRCSSSWLQAHVILKQTYYYSSFIPSFIHLFSVYIAGWAACVKPGGYSAREIECPKKRSNQFVAGTERKDQLAAGASESA
jgi:hypothetical protein